MVVLFVLLGRHRFRTCVHGPIGILLRDPAIRFHGFPILRGKVIAFIINHVLVHVFIELVQSKERDHGVTMMLGVKVSVPKQGTDDQVGSNTASVAQTIGLLGNVTVGVFEIAEVVDDWITAQDWQYPPVCQVDESMWDVGSSGKDDGVDGELRKCSTLQLLHDSTVFSVVKVLEAPSSSTIIDWNTGGRKEDASQTTLEGRENIEKLAQVGDSTERDVAKSRILKLFACVEAC